MSHRLSSFSSEEAFIHVSSAARAWQVKEQEELQKDKEVISKKQQSFVQYLAHVLSCSS